MLPHQERVVEELDQLISRLDKLQKFVDKKEYELLPNIEKKLLHRQLLIMMLYEEVLRDRINYFNEPKIRNEENG